MTAHNMRRRYSQESLSLFSRLSVVYQAPRLGQATSHLRISHTSAHLPGGLVQQGCMCGGSLRAFLNEFLATTAVGVLNPQGD